MYILIQYYRLEFRLHHYIKGMRSGSRDLFKFWEVTDNISETVQDRDIAAMEE